MGAKERREGQVEHVCIFIHLCRVAFTLMNTACLNGTLSQPDVKVQCLYVDEISPIYVANALSDQL